jgi:mRNA interferase HicA
MKAGEFLRKLKAPADPNNVIFAFVAARGKGSHGTVYYGSAFTRLKDLKKELGPGLMRSMCRDLGIDPRDL